jgi:hypothetical protein
MKIWTTQAKEFYDLLMEQGYAYCLHICETAEEGWKYPYDWMVEQMRKRIGEPPLPEIKYPVWAWYQYGSGKHRKPELCRDTMSCGECPSGIEVMMELDVPDNEVLLSDFDLWHVPLNHSCYLVEPKSRRLKKMLKRQGRKHLYEFPEDLQAMVRKSWEKIFDLRLNHKSSYNKYIQGTLWWVKKEWLVSTEQMAYADLPALDPIDNE